MLNRMVTKIKIFSFLFIIIVIFRNATMQTWKTPLWTRQWCKGRRAPPAAADSRRRQMTAKTVSKLRISAAVMPTWKDVAAQCHHQQANTSSRRPPVPLHRHHIRIRSLTRISLQQMETALTNNNS